MINWYDCPKCKFKHPWKPGERECPNPPREIMAPGLKSKAAQLAHFEAQRERMNKRPERK